MEIDHTIYELQEFLDGGLTGENEAELLHRLSVSPERRELLRSFMKQQSVIAADRAAIAVPYGAEQKLWASLAMLPPVGGSVIATTGAATTEVVSTNVASSLLKAAAVATIGLIIGFSSGYFTGRSTAELSDRVHSERIVVPSVTTSAASVAEISATTPISVSEHSLLSHRSINTSGRKSQLREENLNYPEAPQLSDISRPPSDYLHVAVDANNSPVPGLVPEAALFATSAVMIREPGADRVNRDRIVNYTEGSKPSSFLLDHLEFDFHESLGKQFPNSTATNVSLPIVTNLEAGAKWMIIPEFWVGASFGLSNMTQKQLIENPPTNNSTTYIVTSQLVHENTGWFGINAQYRHPITSAVALSAGGGVAASSFGPILSAELGLRIDVTSNVGISSGMRMTRVTSNVAKQVTDLLSSTPSKSDLGFMPGVTDETPSYNLELSTGIYLHF